METLRSKKGFICDMDGVIYHGNKLLDGVKEFVEWLQKEDKRFLFLTNASSRSPRELHEKLLRMGLDVGEEHFYTSALATAKFLQSQAPGCSAYVIGDHGLYNALYDAGITIDDVSPDYVVVVDETLLKSVDVTSGLKENGALIINSKKTPEEVRKLLNGYKGRVCVVDAEKISMETLGKNFPNTPMLAAVVKVSNVIDSERFIKDMRESFQHKFAHKENLIEGNMKALVKAMEEVKVG